MPTAKRSESRGVNKEKQEGENSRDVKRKETARSGSRSLAFRSRCAMCEGFLTYVLWGGETELKEGLQWIRTYRH